MFNSQMMSRNFTISEVLGLGEPFENLVRLLEETPDNVANLYSVGNRQKHAPSTLCFFCRTTR